MKTLESTNRIEKQRQYLRYDYTPEEMMDLSKKLARANLDVRIQEEEQKRIAASLKAEIADRVNTVSDLSTKLNNGHEYRNVECEIRFHEPKEGMKTVVRMDSGQIVTTGKMSGVEMQEVLFDKDAL